MTGRAVTAADLRLVIPAGCCWLVAGLLTGLQRASLAEASGWCSAGFFAAAVALVLIALVRQREGGGERRHSSRQSSRHSRRTFATGRLRARRLQARRTSWGRRPTAPLALVALCCAAAGLVSACIAAELPAREPTALAPLLAHTVTLRMTVTSAPVATALAPTMPTSTPGPPTGEAQLRFDATASSVRSGATSVEAQLPVMVFVRAPAGARHAEIGEQFEATGRLKPTEPGESVVALFYPDGSPRLVEPAPWFLGWANGLRAGFRQSAVGLPGDGGELVPGLAIGDVSLVSDHLDAQMTGSGLSHLTAVSGANCAIVVAAIMLLGGALGLSRRGRIVLSLAVMCAFVVLVTPSSSVLRAAVMATIVLVTLASGRAPKGLPALGLATIILLSADPWLARNYGLALSVLATGGLLLLTRPLHAALSRWMPGWLSLVIAVPLAAQVACQPVLLLLSPTISTYSVVANLLAEPAAPVATVVGLVSCVVGAVVPPLAPVGAWLTWVPASWIAGVARFFTSAPGSSLPWPPGMAGVLLVVLVSAAGLTALLLGPRAGPLGPRVPSPSQPRAALGLPGPSPGPLRAALGLPGPSPSLLRPSEAPRGHPGHLPTGRRPRPRDSRRTVRLAASAVVLFTIAGYLGSTFSGVLFPSDAWPANWQIAACDIGQGDAVVVRSTQPGQPDRFALVDVGPDPLLLTACLDRLRITAIDLLVLTHYDLDHVGGLDAVVGRVTTVLMGPPEDARDARMATTLTASGAVVKQARRGDSGTLGDIGWEVLWPEDGTALRGNDASVTVQFSGAIRSIFLGDLGEESQRLLTHASALSDHPADALADEDVVKVAHHGSADQSEPLYQALRAEVGIVSVGADNRYGHPTDRLLGILARAGTAAYRTDLLGMIVLAPSPAGIVVWSEGQARVEARTK